MLSLFINVPVVCRSSELRDCFRTCILLDCRLMLFMNALCHVSLAYSHGNKTLFRDTDLMDISVSQVLHSHQTMLDGFMEKEFNLRQRFTPEEKYFGCFWSRLEGNVNIAKASDIFHYISTVARQTQKIWTSWLLWQDFVKHVTKP